MIYLEGGGDGAPARLVPAGSDPADPGRTNRERTGQGRTTPARVGKKTGPKPRFTVEEVVDAALDIGIGSFTLADVARRLGVATSALYRVVDGRDALVDLCLRRWIERVPMPDPSLGWQDQLRAFADALWEAHAGNPGMVAAMIDRPQTVQHVYGPLAEFCRALDAAGLEGGPGRIAFAVDFVADTVHMAYLGSQRYGGAGRGTDGQGTEGQDAEGQDADGRGADAQRDGDAEAGGEEVLREYVEGVGAQDEPDWSYRTWLRRKVEFIVAGLEAGL